MTCFVTLQVCDEPLHSIRVQEQGRLVACGSHTGTTTLLELSDTLYTIQRNEKNLVTAVGVYNAFVINLTFFCCCFFNTWLQVLCTNSVELWSLTQSNFNCDMPTYCHRSLFDVKSLLALESVGSKKVDFFNVHNWPFLSCQTIS